MTVAAGREQQKTPVEQCFYQPAYGIQERKQGDIYEKSNNIRNIRPASCGTHKSFTSCEGTRRLSDRSRFFGRIQCYQGQKSIYSFEDRKKILEAVRYVDEVLPEYTWEQKIDDVVNNNVDVFVMGDDWAGKFDFLKDYCEVVYLPRTEGISTSKIKEDLGIHGSKED